MSSEIEHDLRTASDSVLATLDELERLEVEKRTLAPESERFQRLANEIERLASIVFAQTRAQQQLGERSQVVSERTGITFAPINDMVTMRDMQAILTEWRAAERALAATDPDTAEHAQASADVHRLRDEYQRAYSAQSGTRADEG